MSKVTMRYLGLIREYSGTSKEEVEVEDGATIRTLLDKLADVHGERFRTHIRGEGDSSLGELQILLNGVNIVNLRGLDTVVRGDAEVHVVITPAISGG